MALPEQQPEVPLDQQVQEVPDAPEIPAAAEQGIIATPTAPVPVTGSNHQTIASPIPAPSTGRSSITIPAQDQTALEAMAKGRAEDSQTWFGVFWLMKIKRAIKDGLLVLFGPQQ